MISDAKFGQVSRAFDSVACQHIFIIPNASSTTKQALKDDGNYISVSGQVFCMAFQCQLVLSGKDRHHSEGGERQLEGIGHSRRYLFKTLVSSNQSEFSTDMSVSSKADGKHVWM